MATPNTGIPYVPEGTLDPAAGLNLALNHIDGLLQSAVVGTLNDPPVTPPDGSQYIVGVGTGAWVGQDDNVARYVAEGDFWQFYTAGTEVREVLDESDFSKKAYDGSNGWVVLGGLSDAPSDGSTYGRKDGAWAVVGGGATTWGSIGGTLSDQIDLQAALNAKLGDAPSDGTGYVRKDGAWAPESGGGGAVSSVNGDTGAVLVLAPIGIACSDETTALTAGAAKATFRMPTAMTLTGIRASLTTAQTSGNIFTVDVNEGGVSILSTKLTIDNTEKTSTTAAIPAVISDPALADDAEITVDIDQIGDGTAKGLKVWLIGYAP